jgi:hypothetical protein
MGLPWVKHTLWEPMRAGYHALAATQRTGLFSKKPVLRPRKPVRQTQPADLPIQNDRLTGGCHRFRFSLRIQLNGRFLRGCFNLLQEVHHQVFTEPPGLRPSAENKSSSLSQPPPFLGNPSAPGTQEGGERLNLSTNRPLPVHEE